MINLTDSNRVDQAMGAHGLAGAIASGMGSIGGIVGLMGMLGAVGGEAGVIIAALAGIVVAEVNVCRHGGGPVDLYYIGPPPTGALVRNPL